MEEIRIKMIQNLVNKGIEIQQIKVLKNIAGRIWDDRIRSDGR